MAKEKANETDLRAMLAQAAEESGEDITKLLQGMLTMEKVTWAYCPDHNKKIRVDYPDYNGMYRLLNLWLDQGFGKTGTGAPGKTSEAAGKKPEFGKPLEKMTAEERDSYAAHLLAKYPELKSEFEIIKADALGSVEK